MDPTINALVPYVAHPEVRDLVRRAVIEERRGGDPFPDGIELGPLFVNLDPMIMLGIARTMVTYVKYARHYIVNCGIYIDGLFMGMYIPSIRAICIDTDAFTPAHGRGMPNFQHYRNGGTNYFSSDLFPETQFVPLNHPRGIQMRDYLLKPFTIGTNIYFSVEDGFAHYTSHVDIGPDFVRCTYPTPRGSLVIEGSVATLGDERGEVRLESGDIMIAEIGARVFRLGDRRAVELSA